MIAAIHTSGAWFVCALAVACLAARAPWRPLGAALAAGMFLAVYLAATALSPRASWIAMAAAVLACWRLMWGRSAAADLVWAGACAGLAAALHTAHGMAGWLACLLSISVLAVGGITVRRASARPALRDPGLAIAASLGVAIGFWADLAAGWGTARDFNQDGAAAAQATSAPLWTVGLITAAVAAGFLRGMYRRR